MNKIFASEVVAEIFDRRYMVKVPAIDSASETYLKMHGTYITGDRNIDRANINAMMTTMITINQMVEYYRDGVTIALCKRDDSKLIYNAIEAHLNMWINHLRFGVNTYNAPIDDLILMDRFANAIYEHARHIVTPGLIDDIFGQRAHERFNFLPDNIFSNQKKPEVKVDDLPKRESYADILKAKINSTGRF